MRFRVNPVSEKLHWGKWNKNKTNSPSSNSKPFLAALHFSFMICRFLHLPSMIFASLARRQLACLLYKQATGYYMLQIGSDIKEQIQSAFKCTRIYYPIWKIIQASGAILIQKQWTGLINISKLDQLIISPKATLKSKLDTEGDFICSFLGCLRLEIYCSYSRGQNSPHYTPSPISLSCVINIFFQYSQTKIVLNAVLLIWHEDNLVVDWAVLVPVQPYRVDICLTWKFPNINHHGSISRRD